MVYDDIFREELIITTFCVKEFRGKDESMGLEIENAIK